MHVTMTVDKHASWGNSLARMHDKSSVLDTDGDLQACNNTTVWCHMPHQIVSVYSATQNSNVTAGMLLAAAFMSGLRRHMAVSLGIRW